MRRSWPIITETCVISARLNHGTCIAPDGVKSIGYRHKKQYPAVPRPRRLSLRSYLTMFKNKLAWLSAVMTTLFSSTAFAQSAAANRFDAQAIAALGAGLAIGLAVLGGGLGQGRAAAAALEGISRNPGAAPRIQTPMILGLALIESLVLMGFVIAFLLQGFVSSVE
jgi:F-type H+-transporting ATPase subunit c